MSVSILDSLLKAEDIDVTEKAYEYIKGYTLSNHSRFNAYRHGTKDYLEDDILGSSFNSFGLYDNNVYYYFTHQLQEILNNAGYDAYKILAEKNADGSIKSASKQKKYRNKNIRVYAIPLEPVDTELYENPFSNLHLNKI